MSVRANPTVIGAFVLGASIVLVAGLLFWGGTGLFQQKFRYVMYFDSAVTGLQKGAPVLMRGVRIGEVKDVQIRWGKSLVGVYVDMEPDNLRGVPPRDIHAAIENAIKERAFRAQLRAQSFVTGVLYVAIDEFPGTPIVLRGLDPSVLEMPTVPTDLEKWEAKLERLSDTVAALPLREIAQSVLGTVEEARRLLKSPEVARSLKSLDAALVDAHGLIRKADTLAENVNAQVGPLSADAQATLKSAQAALAEAPALLQEARRVVAKIDAHADPLLTSLEKTSNTAGVTLERAQVTLGGVDGTLSQDSALGYELGKALREVRETVRALGSLADFLERNPDALVYGVRRPAQNGR
jgi:phospholipid/cholesterol/gamma-HCH transport system substrate-binding protein